MTYRERIEALIEYLIEALDRVDGDIDLEAENNDGEPLFLNHSAYGARLADRGDNGAGAPEDAEDDDPDEGSYILVTTQSGRVRMA